MDASHDRFHRSQPLHSQNPLRTRCDSVEGAHTWDVAGAASTAAVITDPNQPWGTSGCTRLRQMRSGCSNWHCTPKAPRWPRWSKRHDFRWILDGRENHQWTMRNGEPMERDDDDVVGQGRYQEIRIA